MLHNLAARCPRVVGPAADPGAGGAGRLLRHVPPHHRRGHLHQQLDLLAGLFLHRPGRADTAASGNNYSHSLLCPSKLLHFIAF